jgi:hypothetical protein
MKEGIDEYERVYIEQTLWLCPECEGVLDLLGDPGKAEQRTSEGWREDPEKWADTPAVECIDCGQRYRIRFEAVD